MQPTRISDLIARLIAGQITQSEKEELDKLMIDADPESLSEEIAGLIPESPAPPFDETLLPISENVLQLDRNRNAAQPTRIRPLRTRWMSYAAAVLVLVAAGTYFWFAQHSKNVPAQVAKSAFQNTNDIHPGSDGAILTLADGSKIVLDSASDGAISRQGNSSVLLKNGKLAYQSEGTAQVEILYNTMTTPRGRQYQLTLPDGTMVWLNAASSITYPTSFAGDQRKVTITGEVYFEVAKDPSKRFLVTSGSSTTEALGTHFNVNAYRDEKNLRITLLEGSIKVSDGRASRLVAPGEQAQLGDNGHIDLSRDIDLDQVMAWKNGWFYFERTNILAIMKQIERWYNVEVVYEDVVDHMDFSGAVQRKKNISEALKFLEMTGVVHFRTEGQKIYVSK